MKNSTNLPQQSENSIRICSNINTVKASVSLAIERTGTDLFDIEELCNDVLTEFQKVDIEIIIEAIRKGSLGAYGRTYRFSTQEVCIWIREHLKTKNTVVSRKNFVTNNYNLKTKPNGKQ